MADFLDILAKNALENIKEGYYSNILEIDTKKVSLRKAIIEEKKAPIITEIKPASPSVGIIRRITKPEEIAENMEKGGAIAISVLTEPNYFKGSLTSLSKIKESVKIPVFMKDIILNPIQIEAGVQAGSDAILLIKSIFDRDYCKFNLEDMISYIHSKGLEVLLETHNEKEFIDSIDTAADLVGINNRDLRLLKVNLSTTKKILENNQKKEKIVVSESGIKTPSDLIFLHECGADAFLIGSAIMKSPNVREKVMELVSSIDKN